MDIREYLEEKGCEVKDRGVDHVSTHCMFCEEETSKLGRFYINVDEYSDKYGLFFCFLCNEKGGLNKLRQFYGDEPIKLEQSNVSSNPIFEVACKYYEDRLMENPKAYKFLMDDRGFSHETIKEARFGWADNGLCEHLTQKGFDADDIMSTGLVNQFGEDYFHDEIIIPYLEYGIATQLRSKKIGGKYRSAQGAKAMLYGIDYILGEDTVTLTEGELCALHLNQIGIPAVGVPGAQTWKKEWTELLEDAKRVYIVYDADKPGKAGAEKVAKELGVKARIVELPLPKIDIEDYIVKYNKNYDDIQYLFRKAAGGLLVSVREAYEKWAEIEGNDGLSGLHFNIQGLDKAIPLGLLPGQVLTMLARSNSGKGHPLDTDIQTPYGLMKWGDLEIGDEIYGSNGSIIRITNIFDRGVLPTYKVTFSDKTSVLCDGEHIWNVHKITWRNKQEYRNYTTEQLLEEGLIYKRSNGIEQRKFNVPMAPAIYNNDSKLTIEPYTLGVLIANGYLSGCTTEFRTPDADVVERVRLDGYDVRDRSINKTGQHCPSYGIADIRHLTRDLGIDVKSADKFIPEEYFTASIQQRIDLLHGLFNSDGSNVSHPGRSINYHTTSEKLAEDVVRLVNTLGGTGSISFLNRVGDNGKPYKDITVSVMLPLNIKAFDSDRKSIDQKYSVERLPRRAIVSIERVEDQFIRCITVDAEDQLYLIGKNLIVTHNTLWTINLFQRMKMANPDIKILFISLEQMRNEYFHRAYRILNAYQPGATVVDTINYWENNLLLVDRNRITEVDLRDIIDQYAYEMGYVPDLIFVDYLGYYARSFSGTQIEKITQAIMGLKEIAKDYETVVGTPTQANRTNTLGTRLSMDQSKDSSTIEETSDFQISLWRPDQADPNNESIEREPGVIYQEILKSRGGSTGDISKYLFGPLTLSMVPFDDPAVDRVYFERQCAAAGDSFQQFIHRIKTGDTSI